MLYVDFTTDKNKITLTLNRNRKNIIDNMRKELGNNLKLRWGLEIYTVRRIIVNLGLKLR
jgi:hypothetical protein